MLDGKSNYAYSTTFPLLAAFINGETTHIANIDATTIHRMYSDNAVHLLYGSTGIGNSTALRFSFKRELKIRSGRAKTNLCARKLEPAQSEVSDTAPQCATSAKTQTRWVSWRNCFWKFQLCHKWYVKMTSLSNHNTFYDLVQARLFCWDSHVLSFEQFFKKCAEILAQEGLQISLAYLQGFLFFRSHFLTQHITNYNFLRI